MKLEKFNLASLPVPVLFDAATRVLGFVIALAAILLASRWLTEMTAPRPVARLPAVAQAPGENGSKSIRRLFGASETQAQATDGLFLTGVFAGSKGGGFAIIRTPKGMVSVFPGDEVVPGIKLKQIEKDRVLLLTPDSTRELLLTAAPEQSASVPVQAGVASSPATPVQAAATMPTQASAIPVQTTAAPPPEATARPANRRRHARHSSQGDDE